MIAIVERDGDVVHLIASLSQGTIDVITELHVEQDALVLRGLHIEGPGPGTAGIAVLRELARELGRQFGARRVVVFGGMRTTGARPGHMPRPIVIEVD